MAVECCRLILIKYTYVIRFTVVNDNDSIKKLKPFIRNDVLFLSEFSLTAVQKINRIESRTKCIIWYSKKYIIICNSSLGRLVLLENLLPDDTCFSFFAIAYSFGWNSAVNWTPSKVRYHIDHPEMWRQCQTCAQQNSDTALNWCILVAYITQPRDVEIHGR